MMRSTAPRLAYLILIAAVPGVSWAGGRCTARSGTALVPLVELYTSEGCSSCPPADRWLSARLGKDHVNFLAFHVDYWDSLGWADRFASPLHTARQRSRAATQGDRTVYTPQVMVGSDVRAPWRDARGWSHTLDSARSAPPGAAIALALEPRANGWNAAVGASAIGARARDAKVWLARFIDGQSTQVAAGENRGVRLAHDRVVIRLYGPWRLRSGPVSEQVALPAAASAWGLVAFVEGADGQLLQSLALNPAGCADKS